MAGDASMDAHDLGITFAFPLTLLDFVRGQGGNDYASLPVAMWQQMFALLFLEPIWQESTKYSSYSGVCAFRMSLLLLSVTAMMIL